MAKARLSILVIAPGTRLAADEELATLVAPASHEWRLSSGNGRELGRSARTFAEADACRRDLLELQTRVGEASALISSAGGGGCWTWRLQLGPHGPAAVGGRRYARRRECRYNLDRFVEALAELEPPRDLFGLAYRRVVPAPVIDLRDEGQPAVLPADRPSPRTTGGRRDVTSALTADRRMAGNVGDEHDGPLALLESREPLDSLALTAGARRAARPLRVRPAPAPLLARRLQPLVAAPAPRLAWQPSIRLAVNR